MARTMGAKDKKRRRKPEPRNAQKSPTPAVPRRRNTAPVPTGPQPAVKEESASGPETIDPRDFRVGIAAELGELAAATDGFSADPGQGSNQPASSAPAPEAAGFDPAALTMEGLANAWRLPFYALARLLAWLRIAPDPEPVAAVGRRHAQALAKASYPIWEYYARQYVNVHPDQAVNVSIGVTVLDGIGIVPDLMDAIEESWRRTVRKASKTEASAASSEPAGQGGPVI